MPTRMAPRPPLDTRVDPALRGPLLVECRDGDRDVVIVAGSEHVPWLLGALWAPAQVQAAPGRPS